MSQGLVRSEGQNKVIDLMEDNHAADIQRLLSAESHRADQSLSTIISRRREEKAKDKQAREKMD